MSRANAARRLKLLRQALKSALRFRLQTSLIGVAALVGVTGTIVSSSYAQSGAHDIVARYDEFGAKMIVITPAASRAVGGRARTGAPVTTLTLADYRALRAAEPSVSVATATVSNSYRVLAGDLNKQAVVIGCEPDYFAIKHWRAALGEIFSDRDDRDNARVALLGSGVARDLFGNADPTGERLIINRVPFTIAGVLEERGRGIDGSDEDDQIYVPLTAGMHRLMNVDHLGGIMLQADQTSDVGNVAEIAATLLAKRHRRFGGQQPDFIVTNQQLILDDQLAAFNRLSFFVRWVSVSALAVCAIGVTGICWISVNGRRTDIGAMRALGARGGDVLLLFLAEALAPAILGAGMGLGFGYVAAGVLEARLGQTPWFDWGSALLNAFLCALLFVIVIAASSRRASRVAPAVALSGG
jgi:putative ABC transport system permease protein